MEPIEHKARMRPRSGAPAGLETDGRCNVIPLAQRTPEDQAKAAEQSLEDKGVKNPQQEAENPAPIRPARAVTPERPLPG